MMKLQEIRNQMWVMVNDRPQRRAKDDEVKRWATLRLIETLQAENFSSRKVAKAAA